MTGDVQDGSTTSLPYDIKKRLLKRKWKKPDIVDLTVLVSKKKVHKLATVRNKIKLRIKDAVRLVLQRGLDIGSIRRGGGGGGGGDLIKVPSNATATVADEDEGAHPTSEEFTIELDRNQIGVSRWIAPNHFYIVQPTLEIYRMPSEDLIRHLRNGLGFIAVRIAYREPPRGGFVGRRSPYVLLMLFLSDVDESAKPYDGASGVRRARGSLKRKGDVTRSTQIS